MKKHWKKLVSFLMAVIMLAIMVPFPLLASAKEIKKEVVSAKETEPGVVQTSPLSVEVTTEKSKYTLLSVIEFKVRITNNSDTAIENIDAVAQLGQDLVFVKGTETTTSKDSLAPGEVYEWSYKAKVSRDGFKKADKLLVPLALMRDVFVDNYSDSDKNLSYGSQVCENHTRANLISAYSNTYSSESTVKVFYDRNSNDKNEQLINGFSEYFDIKNDVNNIDEKYKTDSGYILQEDVNAVLNEVSKYASEKLQQGLIKEYGVEENCVWITLLSGIEFVYMPNVQGVDGADVSTFQPCLHTYSADIQEISKLATDGSASEIQNRIEDYFFINDYDNDEITLDTIKNISDNVVIWHGHGGYTSKHHSFLQTSVKLDETRFLLDPFYYIKNIGYTDEYLSGSIICTSDGYVCVTHKFIDKYLGNLENSFIYLGACSSGVDDELANSFIAKGASTVLVNTGTIHTLYNLAMIESVCQNMTHISQVTGNYYTANEALKDAKLKNGSVCCSEHSETEVKIVGDNSYRFDDNVKSETITGTVKDKVTGAPISNVTLEVIDNSSIGDFETVATTTTNENGGFSLTLPAGSYSVSFNHPDYVYQGISITVEENATTVIMEPVYLTPKDTENPDIPDTAVEFNGHYYQVYDTPMTWDEAKTYCESLGGHLATITSEEENNFIKGLISSGTKNAYWLGALEDKEEGSWKWITGEPFEYTDWGPGEPNNLRGESYLEILVQTGGYQNKWNDCASKPDSGIYDLSNHGLVCEWGTPPDTEEPEDPGFAGGDGTIENPYQVSTPEQLNAVRNDLDAHYIQINDIDMSGWGNWEPIGNNENAFEGTYNGQNYKINNLSIVGEFMFDTVREPGGIGLFGTCDGNYPKLENIHLDNILIDVVVTREVSGISIGGLCGAYLPTNTSISNCSVSGNINCSGSIYCVGGVIGSNLSNGFHEELINRANITIDAANGIYGGIIGSGGRIRRSANYGNINVLGVSYVSCGGISGIIHAAEYCQNYGLISVEIKDASNSVYSFVGGISGESGDITGCVNYGDIKGVTTGSAYGLGLMAGGICPNGNYSYIKECYNLSSSIVAICNFQTDEGYQTKYGYAARIHYSGADTQDCYSVDTCLINGTIPTEYTQADQMNGASLTKEEIEEKIAQIDFGNMPKA